MVLFDRLYLKLLPITNHCLFCNGIPRKVIVKIVNKLSIINYKQWIAI